MIIFLYFIDFEITNIFNIVKIVKVILEIFTQVEKVFSFLRGLKDYFERGRGIDIALMSLCFSFGQGKAEEIKWLKLRMEIGLEEIVSAVFVPGDPSILVTDANFKLVELDASSGIL